MRKQFTVKCKNGSIKHSLAGRSIKSITHLAIGGTPVPKSFVCFERPDRLMFTLNLIDAQQKIINHPLKYVVSFKGKRCNVYQVQGAKVINVSNNLHAFERWTHKAFANLSRDHLKRTGLTSAMKKMILKKARKCGVRLNKINCTKVSLSTLLTFLCYPLSYKLYMKKTGYFSQALSRHMRKKTVDECVYSVTKIKEKKLRAEITELVNKHGIGILSYFAAFKGVYSRYVIRTLVLTIERHKVRSDGGVAVKSTRTFAKFVKKNYPKLLPEFIQAGRYSDWRALSPDTSWAKHEGYLTLKKEYASLDALEVALVQNSSHLSTLNEEQLKLYKYNFNFDKDFNNLIGIQ